MRRYLSAGLGILEVGAGIALIVLGFALPSSRDVTEGIRGVAKITDGTEKQLALAREQVAELRRPELAAAAKKLRETTRMIAEGAGSGALDYETIDALGKSLQQTSQALNTWSNTLDADRIKKVADGMSATADFLEKDFAEATEKTAVALEAALTAYEKDAKQFADLVAKVPTDLQPLQEVHDSLQRMEGGLDKLAELLSPAQVDAIREGFKGLDSSLTLTASQVEKVGGYTYPVITLNGLKPNIEQKSFWPEAPKVAEGLNKAAVGAKAAEKQVKAVDEGLPEFRKSIEAGRASAVKTREAIASALKNRKAAESVMASLPKQTAELAESFPKIGRSFVEMLRKTRKLSETAVALRASQRTLVDGAKDWPQVMDGLKKSAVVLDTAGKRMTAALAKKDEYERAIQGAAGTAKSVADLLPEWTEKAEAKLERQEKALGQMEAGIADLNKKMPETEANAVRLLNGVRWVTWLIGAVAAIHGLMLLTALAGGPKSSPPGAVNASN